MQRMGAGKGSRNCRSCAAGCSLQWSWCVVKGIYYSSYLAIIHKVIYSLPSRREYILPDLMLHPLVRCVQCGCSISF